MLTKLLKWGRRAGPILLLGALLAACGTGPSGPQPGPEPEPEPQDDAVEIVSFVVSEAEPDPGSTVVLSWEVTGEYDLIMLSSDAFAEPQDVTGTDAYSFVVPRRPALTEFRLTVTAESLEAPVTATTFVDATLDVCEDPGEVVQVPDAALAALIRAELKLADDVALRCSDMRDLTRLDSANFDSNRGDIASVVGLQHAINLEHLNLAWNFVEDLWPLSQLTTLTYLNFDKNRVTDLTPLEGLTNLETVGFWSSGGATHDDTGTLSDISALANLPHLKVAYLSENLIEDIGALSGLDEMEILFLIGNRIGDASSLEGMDRLRVLRLTGQGVGPSGATGPMTGLRGSLASMTALNYLELSYVWPDDLSGLGELDRLFYVNLEGARATNSQLQPLLDNIAFPDLGADRAYLAEVLHADVTSLTPGLRLQANCLDLTDEVFLAELEEKRAAGYLIDADPDLTSLPYPNRHVCR